MDALRQMIDATAPGGLILDLKVIRPDPYVELDGEVVARIDGEPLFAWADAATAAVEARIIAGDLVEEAVDDHDVRKHYSDGAELVEDVAGSKRRIPTRSCRGSSGSASRWWRGSDAAYGAARPRRRALAHGVRPR